MKPRILLMLALTSILSACDQDDDRAQKPVQKIEAPVLKQAEPVAVESQPAEQTAVETEEAPVAQIEQPVDTTQAVATEPVTIGEQVYNKSCFTCHKTGAAGAPKVGDKTAWAPRIAKGMDALMQSAINGVPGTSMVQRGTCFACSDEELKAAIEYMTSLSQ